MREVLEDQQPSEEMGDGLCMILLAGPAQNNVRHAPRAAQLHAQSE